jgi:hypothetical protein
LPLNPLKPTKAKERMLRETYQEFFSIVNDALGFVGDVRSRAELHNKTYEEFRGQISCGVPAYHRGYKLRLELKEDD